MGESYKISIVPNTSLWMKLGRTKYTIPKALSELVDNSIDNTIGDKVKVDIHFSIDGDYIGILDNAKGMDVETLARALTIADHIEDDNKIGEHGFGLESASSYLGNNLLIYTKTEEMDKYLKFYYNQQDFLIKNQWTVDYEYIDLKQLKEETGFEFTRGTYIKIEDLNVRLYSGLVSTRADSIEGTMVTKFQSIYKKFIEKDLLELTLHVERRRGNLEHIEIQAPSIQNLAFKVNFEFKAINNGKELNIKGWAGILDFYDENTRNKKRYTSGFDIISKNKVILQHLHLGYSYHPEKRLLLGEIELENFQTTSDKTDFIRNSDWQTLELVLKQYITKPSLYIASTAYLNSICDKVANDEDFDLNLDFNRMLMRTALNDESSREFIEDLAPARLTESRVAIVDSTFDNCKDKIADYMKIKRAKENEARNNSLGETMESTISALNMLNVDSEEDEDDYEDDGSENGIRGSSGNSEESNEYLDFIEDVENISDTNYRVSFTHNKLKINHKLEHLEICNQYTFKFDSSNGVLDIISNANQYVSLYTNMKSYCSVNIMNAVLDNTLIIASESMELTEELVARIRGNIANSLIVSSELFAEYSSIGV